MIQISNIVRPRVFVYAIEPPGCILHRIVHSCRGITSVIIKSCAEVLFMLLTYQSHDWLGTHSRSRIGAGMFLSNFEPSKFQYGNHQGGQAEPTSRSSGGMIGIRVFPFFK